MIIEYICEFMGIPEFVQSVGWMIAVAMLIGGLVVRRMKNFLAWTFTTFVFLAFQEWLRYIYFTHNSNQVFTGRTVVFTLLAGVLFFVGLCAGMLIAWGSKRKYRIKCEKKIVKKFNGNGNIVEMAINGNNGH